MAERDPKERDNDNWVVPIPTSDSPAYAVMPWALFQRLRALADDRRATAARDPSRRDSESDEIHLADSAPLDLDMNMDFDRVVPISGRSPDELWPTTLGSATEFDYDGAADSIPPEVLERLLDGEHPLKVFRRYRALTQKQLAELTGLNATYLSQIEIRKRHGSTRVYRRLATALGVDIGDLIE